MFRTEKKSGYKKGAGLKFRLNEEITYSSEIN